MRTNVIAVGTDGTACSTAAVRWAAREAARRNASLRIVHVFDGDWGSARFDAGSENVDVDRQLAEAVTTNALAEVRKVAPAGACAPAGQRSRTDQDQGPGPDGTPTLTPTHPDKAQ